MNKFIVIISFSIFLTNCLSQNEYHESEPQNCYLKKYKIDSIYCHIIKNFETNEIVDFVIKDTSKLNSIIDVMCDGQEIRNRKMYFSTYLEIYINGGKSLLILREKEIVKFNHNSFKVESNLINKLLDTH